MKRFLSLLALLLCLACIMGMALACTDVDEPEQTPGEDDVIDSKLSKIILYTEKISEYVTVPKLVGLTVEKAAEIAVNSGLNISIRGSSVGGTVTAQSLPLGAKVKRGQVVVLDALALDFED